MVKAIILAILPLGAALGQQEAAALAVLEKDCQGCHGAAMALSKLDLRTRDSVLKGGTRGPAVIPGNAAGSLLAKVLEGRDGAPQMPPGKRVDDAAIDAIKNWINAGAKWPAQGPAQTKWNLTAEDLWAFRPQRPFDKSQSIDGLLKSTAPKAGKRLLIRRATIDLTGLPPTPEEVEAFLADQSPKAYENLIDRLLASPRYGERQARHWLDVVRYADSSGYSNDFERPNAWRYRDYVIRAFNQDKPYDQFIREQIAGDELYAGNGDALIATGFLRAGPWEHTGMSVEAVTRQMFLDDVTHSTVSTFLGLTAGCAKCHDHKFDPIPTRDYYRVQAVFATTEFARAPLPWQPGENPRGFEEGSAGVRKRHAQARDKTAAFRKLGLENLMKRHGVTRPEDLPKGEADKINGGEGLPAEVFEEMKLYQKHTQVYQDSLDRYVPKAFSVSSGPLDGATDGGPNLRYPKRADYKPTPVHILPGGNIQAPAEAVTPGVLSALEVYGGYPAPQIPESVAGRRSALAHWIADPKNPLTARVMVNRLWQTHFGAAIAGDPSNFGKMGKKPANPDLLDWLAGSLIESGWSVKKLHRQILLSQHYQSTAYQPKRIEAEVLRDSLLAVSGELSLETGGPGTFPQINEDVARQPQHRMGSLAPAYLPSPKKNDRNRRTIYAFQQRSLIDPMIDVFNGPGLDLSCERRETSTVATQAFALFNSQFAHDLSLAFAQRLEREAATLDQQLDRAFQLAYGRPAAPEESKAAKAHVLRQLTWHEKNPPPAKPGPEPLVHKITSELTGEVSEFRQNVDQPDFEPNVHATDVKAATRALADFALVIFNTNEFIYVY